MFKYECKKLISNKFILGLFIILFDLFAQIGIDFIINIPNFFA